jgi:hypothetical protein
MASSAAALRLEFAAVGIGIGGFDEPCSVGWTGVSHAPVGVDCGNKNPGGTRGFYPCDSVRGGIGGGAVSSKEFLSHLRRLWIHGIVRGSGEERGRSLNENGLNVHVPGVGTILQNEYDHLMAEIIAGDTSEIVKNESTVRAAVGPEEMRIGAGGAAVSRDGAVVREIAGFYPAGIVL